MDDWKLEGSGKIEVVVAWPLLSSPKLKMVTDTNGCNLVGFTTHSITLSGDGTASDCHLLFIIYTGR